VAGSAKATTRTTAGAIAFDQIDTSDPNTGAFHASIWIATWRARARRLVTHSMVSAIDVSWAPGGKELRV
jgi:hypothetical protein